MLNSVSSKIPDVSTGVPPEAHQAPSDAVPERGQRAPDRAPRARVRMSKEERRRQLVGLGLEALTVRPIQEVSLDSVAAEAGISRGLLFHYFPTKTAFYEAVVGAAGRRVMRNVIPVDAEPGEQAIREMLERFVAQVERRRDVYLALVQGNLADLGGNEVAGTLRGRLTDYVAENLEALDLTPPRRVVHAWLAYVEDVVVEWSDPAADRAPDSDPLERDDVVSHCEAALGALIGVEGSRSARQQNVSLDLSALGVQIEFVPPRSETLDPRPDDALTVTTSPFT